MKFFFIHGPLMARTAQVRFSSKFLVICALVCLCIYSTLGCHSSQVLTRPDLGDESLEISSDWRRTPHNESESVLFAVSHRKVDVSARLHRLHKTYDQDILLIWITAWVEARWQNMMILNLPDEKLLPEVDIQRLNVMTKHDDSDILIDVYAFNADGKSYYIEQWGELSAMNAINEEREALVRGLTLPSSSNVEPETSVDGILSAGVGSQLTAKSTFTWNYPIPSGLSGSHWTSQEGEHGDAVEFALDERLLHGVGKAEALPYRVRPERYVQTALEDFLSHPRRSLVEQKFVTPHTIEVVVESAIGEVPMTHVYRFIIRNSEAFQWSLSTPSALYQRNLPIIESFFDSIILQKQ